MHTILTAVLMAAAVPGAGAASGAAAATAAASFEQQVDALFAKWSKPDTPGAAIAIIRDGKVVLRKGYGMADMEHAVPITSKSVFNVGSVAKQFTACAIHLLAQEGKLWLDDDIRRHLPDMPDFGKTVTIRHLLLHTSGLRDSSNLLWLAGWRPDDVATHDDILDLLKGQRELNFAPGSEHAYSNAGYNVLAAIVERVAGKPLAEFASERIFKPLGMTQTRFQTHYGDLVPGRALAYQASGGGYRTMASPRSAPGPGDLLSTVEDLALWDANFEHGRVGGRELMAKMQESGVLADGKPVNYASGLYTEDYRGARLVEHLGGTGGYAAQMSRIPAKRFTVIVLANSPAVGPTAIARRAVDIYLGSELAPLPVKTPRQPPAEVAVDAPKLAPLAGYYAIRPDFGFQFLVEDGQLMVQPFGFGKHRLYASGAREFFFKDSDTRFSFDAPGVDGLAPRVVMHQGGREQPGLRAPLPVLAEADLNALEGDYYSDELRVLYSVVREDGKLVLRHPRGRLPMRHVGARVFLADFPAGRLFFDCLDGAACTGFKVNTGRVLGLRFRKVSLAALPVTQRP